MQWAQSVVSRIAAEPLALFERSVATRELEYDVANALIVERPSDLAAFLASSGRDHRAQPPIAAKCSRDSRTTYSIRIDGTRNDDFEEAGYVLFVLGESTIAVTTRWNDRQVGRKGIIQKDSRWNVIHSVIHPSTIDAAVVETAICQVTILVNHPAVPLQPQK